MTGSVQKPENFTAVALGQASAKMAKKHRHTGSYILRGLVRLSGALVAAFFLLLVGFILVKGIPNLKPSLFSLEFNSENVSMLPAIFNTLEVIALTLLLAVPLGVGAAVYLTEYAKRGSKLVKVIRMTTETLQGIPSIVYGLFGFIVFVITLHWSYSMLAGILTMTVMVLPIIIRTTEEAILAVPDSFREASFGLGAGKVRTVFRVILPAAMPGILSGVILATGRVAGETAALIFTSGTAGNFTGNPMNSARTLAVHLYSLWNEGLYTNEAYATMVVLLVMVVLINALSDFVSRKLVKHYGN